ncbi:hypothetical protein [Paenibacillus gansuensis]|uniref:Uncharacterized protein n=1 Tax=Paenibacillus gansuensis TaxID=306542 RepID=A0ABW5P7U5_9BACL
MKKGRIAVIALVAAALTVGAALTAFAKPEAKPGSGAVVAAAKAEAKPEV